MPSLRSVFTAVWRVLNIGHLGRGLFLFLFGLFFLFGAAYYGFSPRVSAEPEPVDLAGARRIVEQGKVRHVRLWAEPDFSRPIHRTGAWSPFWGNCPPGEVRRLDLAAVSDKELEGLLGCRVAFTGRVDLAETRTATLPASRDREKPKTAAVSPLAGTGKRIWIFSKTVSDDNIDISPWRDQESFEGVLATWDLALEGLPSGLSGHARRVLPDMERTYAVVPGAKYGGEALEHFTSRFWVPVKGCDWLFVWTSKDSISPANRTVAGVLEPVSLDGREAKKEFLSHFRTVTGRPLPPRIGLIRFAGAREYNDKQSGYSGVFLIFGVLWTGCGLLVLVIYIMAPGLIYGQWERVLRKAGFRKPDHGPGPDQEEPARGELHGEHEWMYAPPVPPDGAEAPPPSGGAWRTDGFGLHVSGHSFSSYKYGTFIQDFTHPNNPDSGLLLTGLHKERDAAWSELMGSGQRHPGVGIEILDANPALSSWPEAGAETGLDQFEIAVGDYVVLGRNPSAFRKERFVVRLVRNGDDPEAAQQAHAGLRSEGGAALMGRVFVVGDSENGPCGRMRKRPGESIMLPVF